MPAVVVFWMVPPFTVTVPLPVVASAMPLAGPLAAVPAEMLAKVRPLAPTVVLLTFSAVPVVVVSVLALLVLLTVPPPVALKAVLVVVLAVIWPLKLIVAPLLLARL